MRAREFALHACLMLGAAAGALASGTHDDAGVVTPVAPDPASDTVRVWGNPAMRPLAEAWASKFHQLHPKFRVRLRMTGSDVGMAALYTAEADVALLGREAFDNEVKAFEWIYRYKPLAVRVARGSRATPSRSPALLVCVQPGNSLSAISFEQLAALFERRPPGPIPAIRTWDQLGVGGRWSGQAVHLYAPEMESGTGIFFRHAALGDSLALDWERLAEYGDAEPLLAALAKDPLGLAVTAVPMAERSDVQARCKPVPVKAGDAAPTFASEESLIAGRYPLGRSAFAYVNRAPDQPLGEAVREFLRYIVSPAGQRAGRTAHGFLPLSLEAASARPTSCADRSQYPGLDTLAGSSTLIGIAVKEMSVGQSTAGRRPAISPDRGIGGCDR